MPLTLLLADDHEIVRLGLRALLTNEPDFRLVGEASDGLEVLRLADQLKPNVLILDLMMPRMNGLEVARQLTARPRAPRIVILSMHADKAYAWEALRAGASAYVVKDADSDELLQAIRKAARGERYLSRPFPPGTLESLNGNGDGLPDDPYQTLTLREREVLQLTVEGHSGQEISEILFISPRTVESHRANLLRKLDLRNLKQLIRYALQRGLAGAGQPGGDVLRQ